jgi:hypothetical protein
MQLANTNSALIINRCALRPPAQSRSDHSRIRQPDVGLRARYLPKDMRTGFAPRVAISSTMYTSPQCGEVSPRLTQRTHLPCYLIVKTQLSRCAFSSPFTAPTPTPPLPSPTRFSKVYRRPQSRTGKLDGLDGIYCHHSWIWKRKGKIILRRWMVYNLESTRSFRGNGPKTRRHSTLMNYGKPSGEQVLVYNCVVLFVATALHTITMAHKMRTDHTKAFKNCLSTTRDYIMAKDTARILTKHRLEAFWLLLGPIGLTAAGVKTTWSVKGSVA